MKDKKFLYGLLIGCFLTLLVIGLFLFLKRYLLRSKINSFEECARAGYPVSESYPRQCSSADDKIFIEEVYEEEPEEPEEEEYEEDFQLVPACSSGQEINSFQECLQAGYPVTESYPRECQAPDGRIFIDELTFEEATGKANLPKKLLEKAKQDLAGRLRITKSKIEILCAEKVSWSDACLGIDKPGIACIQLITPGFRIILKVGVRNYQYHTDMERVVFAGE